MYPEDIAASIYSALGIDWTKEITNTPSGRVFEYIEFQSGTSFLDVSEDVSALGGVIRVPVARRAKPGVDRNPACCMIVD